MSELIGYLQPRLPDVNVHDTLFRYIDFNRIQRLWLEGGGDSNRKQIVEIIEQDFDCAGEDYILIDGGG